MKILIDARFYGSGHTGLGRYTTNFLQSLKDIETEHEFYLLLNSPYVKTLDFPSNFHKIPCDVQHYSVKEQIYLPIIINRIKPDLFHALHINVPILVNVPFIITIHDLIKSHFTSKDTTTRPSIIFYLKRIGYNIIVKTSVKRARLIICPSNFVKKDIMQMFNVLGSKIHPIYEAADPNLNNITPALKSSILKKLGISDSYILFIGNAYPHKNLSTLIKAFELLQDDSLNLVIVSKNTPFLKKVLNKVKASTKQKIHTLENLSDESIQALYQSAKLTVIPSLMEGFGLIGLESLKSGTNIVVSDIEVFREVYGDAALYADPSSPSSFAKVINQSIKTKVRKELPRKYSWDSLAKEILELYSESSTSLRSTE